MTQRPKQTADPGYVAVDCDSDGDVIHGPPVFH
jgi:hypothetical protein